MFSQTRLNIDGSETVPAELVARWRRQMNTEYPDLPDKEKESDRKEADKILAIVEEP